jgi:hypothetical protein
LNLPNDRDHIGRALVCAVNNFSYRLLARLANLWIAERNATRLSSCQGFRSAPADKRAFFLRKRREQVQDERVNVRAEIGDQERDPVNHQARDEMNITGQPVQLGDGDRATLPARFSKRGGELWSPVDGIGPLAGLDLDVYATQCKALGSACCCASIPRPDLPCLSVETRA